MLILGRRPRVDEDGVTLTTPGGETITVYVVSVNDGHGTDHVKLGFVAEPGVKILRTELLDRAEGGAS